MAAGVPACGIGQRFDVTGDRKTTLEAKMPALRVTIAGLGLLIASMGARALLRGEPDYSNYLTQPVSAAVATLLGLGLFVADWFLRRGASGGSGNFPRGWTHWGHEAITSRPLRARRNQRCPCGSGRKYKRCCLKDDERKAREEVIARRSAELNRSNEPVAGIAMANRGLRGR